MTDPLLPPETFSDAMDEAESGAVPFVTGHFGDVPRAPVLRRGANDLHRPDYGIPTIDMDLGPVDAAPKPKGPAWRLGELRASVRRLEMQRGGR